MTKLFQSRDVILRRMVYLGIKELSGIAEDVIIVTSSLTKDMTGKEDLYRAAAIRALCSITDVSIRSCIFLKLLHITCHTQVVYQYIQWLENDLRINMNMCMCLSLLSCDTLSLVEWLSYCLHLQGWSSPKWRHSNLYKHWEPLIPSDTVGMPEDLDLH